MSNKSCDVLVIGGGPGGYVAAIRAAQLGLDTIVVEEKHMGGICLNWGCIPTKALLKGAEVAHTIATADHFGFGIKDVEFDIQKLVAHSRGVSDRLSGGISYLMKKNGIDVIEGRASLKDKGVVSVALNAGGTEDISASHIILATGARPRSLPHIKADGDRIWTYFEAMVPESLPEKILVVGSGAIGVEFASLYNDLGTDVTLVEVAEKIMPGEEKVISDFAEKSFKKRGMTIHCGASVDKAEVGSDGVTCTITPKKGDAQEVTVDRVILAVGIQGNIENLGLEALKVEMDRGFIKADGWGRTNVVGLYAIGDVSGPPCLAHKASHEGVLCVEHLAGLKGLHPLDKINVPRCTYARPQVASLGLSEEQARAEGFNVKVGEFDLGANGKALAIYDEQGFIRTIFDDDSGELLGAHMIGPEVTEMLQGFGVAQSLEATAEELVHTVFAHPTISEAMHEAILDAAGQVIHK